mmetsp:Transcript_17260/g.34492  ORF Transcript_17260/g.34492 Transcript_17260/m.34492 type:complete len:497 (+) Transcript_17260:54-1544(+)
MLDGAIIANETGNPTPLHTCCIPPGHNTTQRIMQTFKEDIESPLDRPELLLAGLLTFICNKSFLSHWYRIWDLPGDSPKPEERRLSNEDDLNKIDQLNKLSLQRFAGIDDDLYMWLLKSCKLVKESNGKIVINRQNWESFVTTYSIDAEIEPASPLKTNRRWYIRLGQKRDNWYNSVVRQVRGKKLVPPPCPGIAMIARELNTELGIRLEEEEYDDEGNNWGDTCGGDSGAISNETNAYAGGNASDEDAQINTETDGEIGAEETEKVTKEQELQSFIAQLRDELVEKDELIAEKEKDLALTKAILRKIGMMANGKDEDFNHEDGVAPQPRYRGTESVDRTQSQREKELQSEIDSLKEHLKNSKPIETVDLTNEVEPITATEDDSNDEEPPLKRRRTKSNLAVALEQTQQMVSVKEEAIQRATSAEASAQAARREKDSVEASLRDVQEDLEIQQETTELVNLTLDTWQGRFDRVYELAAAAGVDAAVLKSIREGNDN